MAVVVLCCVPGAQAALLVSGYATDLPGSGADDALELWNTGAGPLGLDGLAVLDGEGRVRLPSMTLAGGARLTVTTNDSAYRAASGRAPDWAAPASSVEGAFGLAQGQDELWIEDGTGVLDLVAWGGGEVPRHGWQGARFAPGGTAFLRWYERVGSADTDSAADWERPERLRLGWREGGMREFAIEGDLLAYVAPDQSRRVVLEAVASATSTIRINVYEWRDTGLAAAVRSRLAEAPPVRVDVLVDESPVGLDSEERLVRDRILGELADAGARVRVMTHHRYAYDHAKYMVLDDRRVLVQSENFVPSGLPLDGRGGNRGWGILVDDQALAEALASVFDRDFAVDPFGARDLGPSEHAPVPLPPGATARPQPSMGTAIGRGATVRLVVGPEDNLAGANPFASLVDGARHEVLVEHLRLPPDWRDASGRSWPNPLVDALERAAARGVHVRLLLDGHFEAGAAENAATIRRVAAAGPEAQGRLMTDPDEPVLHVKGVVVDGRWSVVGSTNGNLHSVAQNREVALIVDSSVVAQYFRDVFLGDWRRAADPPTLDGPPPALAATVIMLAAVATRSLRWRTRWSTRTRSSQSPSPSRSSPSRGGDACRSSWG